MTQTKINTCVIMAAGKGTRMLPLTDYIPKPMIKYKDSTLIKNNIDNLKKYVNQIFVNIGYKKEILSKYLLEQDIDGLFNTDGKDNAWWLYNTPLKYLNEPIIVSTCDIDINIDYFKLIQEFKEKNCICLLIPTKSIDKIDGDFIEQKETGEVIKLSRNNKSNIYCSGIQILNPYQILLNTKVVNNFNDVWSQLIKINKLFCSKIFPKYWKSFDNLNQLGF